MSGNQGHANAPPNAFPDMVVGNMTVSGGMLTQGNSTVSGSRVTTGSETISGSASIGAGLSVNGAATSVPAATFTGAETLTGAHTGTLTNCPHTGDPFTYLEISVNGTLGVIPVFATT